MTGDSYYPISIYGFCTRERIDLQKFKSLLNKYIKEQSRKIGTRYQKNKPKIDLYYCVDYAYSRWEGTSPVEIFNQTFDTSWSNSFVVIGTEINRENFDKLMEIKESVGKFKDELKSNPEFYNGIFLYSQLDNNPDDDDDDDVNDI